MCVVAHGTWGFLSHIITINQTIGYPCRIEFTRLGIELSKRGNNMEKNTATILLQFTDLPKMQQAEFINELTRFYRGDPVQRQRTRDLIETILHSGSEMPSNGSGREYAESAQA